jgi:hypothetical protein
MSESSTVGDDVGATVGPQVGPEVLGSAAEKTSFASLSRKKSNGIPKLSLFATVGDDVGATVGIELRVTVGLLESSTVGDDVGVPVG